MLSVYFLGKNACNGALSHPGSSLNCLFAADEKSWSRGSISRRCAYSISLTLYESNYKDLSPQ